MIEEWINVKECIKNDTLPELNTRIIVKYRSGNIVKDRPAWVLTFSEYPEYFKYEKVISRS
jgi:hypothetical protein